MVAELERVDRLTYRYDVRQFKIVDGEFHECSGKVVATLGQSYSQKQKAWYVTVLCRTDFRRV